MLSEVISMRMLVEPAKTVLEICYSLAWCSELSSLGQLVEENVEPICRCSLYSSQICNIKSVSYVFKIVSQNLTEAVMKYFVLLAMGQKIIGH